MSSYAEVVFTGGAVFTAGMSTSTLGAVAVSGGRIYAVGTTESVRELIGSSTEVVDTTGCLVVPGFQDAHVHPVMAGIDMFRCDIHDTASAADTLRLVGEYAATHPDVEWIVGAGWNMSHFPGGCPTLEALDAVVGDRPAFLSNKDGHGAWVSSAALRLAGVDRDTPDPADGRIERNERGEPTGMLHEGAADLVGHLLPTVTRDHQVRGLLAAQDALFARGITSWQDAAVGDVFGMSDILAAYLDAARDGALKARVIGALWWDRMRGSDQIAELVERRAEAAVGRFRATSIKIMQDGVVENFSAALTEPYLDDHGCPTDNSGLSFVDPVGLLEYVTRLDAAGFQVHFHALGDRAVREALDAVETARTANGPTTNRHHLAHLQIVHPDDIARFAELEATANLQPLWAAHEPQMDELNIPYLGSERAGWQYPFRALFDSGAHVAAGSDWSVSSPDPLAGIHVAVNRREPGVRRGPAFFLASAITLAEAMTAYTAGSARVNHQEDSTGHLREGMYADLAVLDGDPFVRADEDIYEIGINSTWIEGERVYSAAT